MTKYLFCKVETKTYEYVMDVPEGTDMEKFKYKNDVLQGFTPETVVDIDWDVDVEEYHYED